MGLAMEPLPQDGEPAGHEAHMPPYGGGGTSALWIVPQPGHCQGRGIPWLHV